MLFDILMAYNLPPLRPILQYSPPPSSFDACNALVSCILPRAHATAFFSGGNFKASLFSPPLSLDGKFNILAHSSALYPPLSFPSSLLALSVVVRSVEGVISSLLHLSDSLQRRESDDRPRAWLTKALYCFILLGASGYKSV